jgi:hypothetical protein
VKSSHDGSTGIRIPGRFRFYTGDPSDRYRIGGPGPHLCLGYLGVSGTFRAWQNGQAVLFDVVWSALRASIVLMVLGFYLR